MIRIGSNIASLTASRRLQENTDRLGETLERLSSGQRINRASDDAAGLSISSRLHSDAHVYTQGIRNLNDGISMLNIAQGTLDQLSQILIRQKELAEQAANGVYTVQQRGAIGKESDALIDEFNRLVDSANFNGLSIFGSNNSQVRLQGGYGDNGGIAVSTSSQLSRNVWNGNFTTSSLTTASPISTGESATADIDGDGHLDILKVNSTVNTISVMYGNGDGTFMAASTINTGSTPSGIAVADFDGDGLLDVAELDTTASGQVQIFKNDGKRGFSAYATIGAAVGSSLLSADLNNDGKIDLIAEDASANRQTIIMNSGNGNFNKVGYVALGNVVNNVEDVTIGDLNGDGRIDLVQANGGSNTFSVALGNGDGSFGAATSFSIGNTTSTIRLGDFNRDGYLDVASIGGNFGISLGNGNGTFGAVTTISVGIGKSRIEIGDIDGDGFTDVVAGGTSSTNYQILIGNGDGTFKAPRSFAATSSTSGFTLGDFNEDGALDIGRALYSAASFQVNLSNTQKSADIGKLYLLTQDGAREALAIIDQHIQRVSLELGNIGAGQSRIVAALKVLGGTIENTLAASSRIEDADIAAESAELARRKILQQTSVAVLAQANLQPQIALKLLSAS